ncbi:hypothetical protein OURE66S_02588 [Oligella ureolytica]
MGVKSLGNHRLGTRFWISDSHFSNLAISSIKDSIKIGSSTVQIAEYENKLENQEKSHNDKIEILERHYKEKLEVLREDSREKIDAITNTANFLASTNFRQPP